MTSVTACSFHEPALLLHEAGGWFGGARRRPIVCGAAEQRQFLLLELACALYAKATITLAHGAEMSGLGRIDFGLEVGDRGIPRHYSAENLAQDLAYADGQLELFQNERASDFPYQLPLLCQVWL